MIKAHSRIGGREKKKKKKRNLFQLVITLITLTQTPYHTNAITRQTRRNATKHQSNQIKQQPHAYSHSSQSQTHSPPTAGLSYQDPDPDPDQNWC